MQPPDDGERVEFVPWDQLRPREWIGAGSSSKLVGIAGALCLVMAVAGWWWVNRPDSEPLMGDTAMASPLATTPLPAVPATTVATPPRVTEADLRAIVPAWSDQAVSAIASEYLRAYLSEESSSIHPFGLATTPLYVEWVGVISAEETDEPDSWLVTMRVGSLELGDEPRRLPVGEYAVFVSMQDGLAEVSIPIRRNGSNHDQVVVRRQVLADVPSPILAGAAIGSEEEILGGWEGAGNWYVVVRDERGLPVAVEVGDP